MMWERDKKFEGQMTLFGSARKCLSKFPKSLEVKNGIRERSFHVLGPCQIALQFGLVVGPLYATLLKKRLEIATRHTGQFRSLTNGKETACVKRNRDLLFDFGLGVGTMHTHSLEHR